MLQRGRDRETEAVVDSDNEKETHKATTDRRVKTTLTPKRSAAKKYRGGRIEFRMSSVDVAALASADF